MIGPTTIGEGTKLDNLIMIAHNCELGRHNAYASQVGFAGSVTTGEYVRCAGQVGVAGHVHLADGCTLAAKSGIQKDVPAGETYFGIPARRVAEQGRMIMAQIKFPEMRKQLRQLQAQVQELTAKLQHLSDSDDKSAAA
jgi:UDP-3-O-[3-hydroxymyristoyl] glucosamine N-acyltransferase